MNDVPEYELLSAYLDGELTAAERVQVEQLLASDPAARQLFSDLRALSSTLQSLPQHRLKESLSDAVLHQAEHEMLAGPLPKDDRPVPQAMAWWSIVRRFTRPRTLVWLGLTAAVAILLSVTDPGRRPQMVRQELAQAPVKTEASPEPRTRSEAPSMRAIPADRGLVSTEPASASPAVAATTKPQADRPLDASKLSFAAPPATPAESVSPPAAAPAPVRADESMLADKEKKDARKGESPQAREQEKTGDMVAGTSLSEPRPVAKTSSAKESPKMLAKASAEKPESGKAESRESADRKDQVASLPVLQIDCYLSVEAAQRQDIERLLARQKMVRQSRSARLAPSEVAADRDAQSNAAAGEKVRVFYCEATPAQVEATLTTLAARPGDLLAVSVSPTTGIGGQVPDDPSMSQFRQAPRREMAADNPAGGAAMPASKASESAVAGKAGAKESASQDTLGSAMTLNAIPSDRASAKATAPSGKSIPKLMADIARWTDREQAYRFVFIVHASRDGATVAVPTSPPAAEKPAAP